MAKPQTGCIPLQDSFLNKLDLTLILNGNCEVLILILNGNCEVLTLILNGNCEVLRSASTEAECGREIPGLTGGRLSGGGLHQAGGGVGLGSA